MAVATKQSVELDSDGFIIIRNLKSITPSMIRAYHACPSCFEKQYILNQRPVQEAAHISFLLGSAVHRGVEEARKALKRETSAGDVDLNSPLPFDIEQCIEDSIAEFKSELAKIQLLDFGGTRYAEMGPEEIVSVANLGLERTEAIYADIRAMSDAALRRIIVPERSIGVAGMEEWVNFPKEVFPFRVRGKLDTRLSDGTIKDLKTANAGKPPDAFNAIQLVLYCYSRHLQGEVVKAQVDQLVKNEALEIFSYPITPTEAEYAAVHSMVIETARAIWKGIFPPRPGFYCKFDHGLPAFTVSVPEPGNPAPALASVVSEKKAKVAKKAKVEEGVSL